MEFCLLIFKHTSNAGNVGNAGNAGVVLKTAQFSHTASTCIYVLQHSVYVFYMSNVFCITPMFSTCYPHRAPLGGLSLKIASKKFFFIFFNFYLFFIYFYFSKGGGPPLSKNSISPERNIPQHSGKIFHNQGLELYWNRS